MDNSIHIEQLGEDALSALQSNPSDLENLIFSNEDDWKKTSRVAMSNHNGWQIIHYLLSDDPWDGEWPQNFLGSIDVGTPISYDEECPPATLFTPQQVKEIDVALASISATDLITKFDPEDENLDEFDSNYEAYDSIDVFLNEHVAVNYEEIKNFVTNASKDGAGLLVAWMMT